MEESLVEENDQPSQAKQRKVHKESCSIDSVELEEKHSQLPESKQHKTDEHNTNNVLMEDLTNKLTHDALLKLFSWLPIDDLVSVQRVCHDWRVAAHYPSLWNNYTLKLVDYKRRDEKNIHIMPALRSIEGSVDNRMLTVILKNILELKHMNCTFKPAISSSQVKKVIETYPRLETIGLDINASDILQSVQKLKASEYLKEVHFYCSAHSDFHDSCHGVSESVCQSNILKVFKVFTNSKNFSVIRGLYMSRCIFKDLFGDLTCSNVVADVIKERSQQLLSLRFVISKISSEVLNSVNMCINLRELCFSVDEMCHVNINFDKMRELQSLTVRMEEEGNTVDPD